MNGIQYTFTLLVLLLVALNACREDVDEFIPDTPNPSFDGNVDELLAELQSDEETFTIRNHELGLRTEYGTVINFPDLDFVFGDGTACTSDEIHVKVIEIHEPGNMILHGTPTITSDGDVLESAGMYHISTWCNNRRVFLAAGKQIQMQIPADDTNPAMQLFYDDGSDPDSFSWELANSGPAQTVWTSEWWVDSTSIDSSAQGGFYDFGYAMFSDSLGWINCDAFYDDPNLELTKVCVDLPEGYDVRNTNVYMVFNDVNSMVRLYGDTEQEMFCISNMPIGFNVTFVVLSEQQEEVYHLGLATADIAPADPIESIEPVETSIDDIQEVLGQL